MTEQNILTAAKQGNPQAIAALINRHLQLKGITAKAKLTDDCLYILVEGSTAPQQGEIVAYVVKGVRGLQVTAIKALVISGRRSGEDLPDWTERVELVDGNGAIDIKAAPDKPIEKGSPNAGKPTTTSKIGTTAFVLWTAGRRPIRVIWYHDRR